MISASSYFKSKNQPHDSSQIHEKAICFHKPEKKNHLLSHSFSFKKYYLELTFSSVLIASQFAYTLLSF